MTSLPCVRGGNRHRHSAIHGAVVAVAVDSVADDATLRVIVTDAIIAEW